MEHILDITKLIAQLLAALGITIEILPVKFSPLKWIGNRLNKNLKEQMNNIENRLDTIEYKTDMKDLADVRNRIISYGLIIRNGQELDKDTLNNIQHDLDIYDYYKETYKYMEINGRKVKINGEIETARMLINEEIKKQIKKK